jgi:hypothetical protein
MRYREDNDTTPFNPSGSIVTKQNNLSASPKRCDTTTSSWSGLGFTYPQGEFRSISDVVVKNFRKRSAAGEVFVNPMSSLKTTRSVTLSARHHHLPYPAGTPSSSKQCTYKYEQSKTPDPDGLNAAGAPTGHLSPYMGSVQNLINLASTTAAANVDNPTFHGATFIAELRETLGFLRNPLGAFNKQLEDYRWRKRARKSLNHKTTGEYIRDNWLSYRYAVRPLVQDIQNAAEAVARTVLDNEPLRQTARGYASESGETEQTGAISSLYDHTTRTVKTVSVRAGILYEISRDPNTFGMTVPDIPVALWEAIPYSFVADWFLNIGSFIQAISPVGGVKRLGSWTTVKTETSTTREIWWERPGTSSGITRVVTSDGRSTETYDSISVTRTPGIQIGLAHKIGPLSGDIGKLRLLDLVALGSQIMRSK